MHHHFLHHFIKSGTAFNVLLEYMSIIFQVFPKMGIPGTIGRTNLVNATHIFRRSRNWQGSVLFSQTLSPDLSRRNLPDLNCSGVFPINAAILLIFFSVNGGVMVLQQLAQVTQSTSSIPLFPAGY
jgi:hypothetical protein